MGTTAAPRAVRPGCRTAALWVVLSLAAVWPGTAPAMTSTGSLITNIACITFSSPSGVGYTLSFCVTAVAQITSPGMLLQKTVSSPAMQSGGTLTYTIMVVNLSALDSAFSVMIEDKIPANVGYRTGQDNWVTGTAGATVTQGYGNTGAFPTYYWSGEPFEGQTSTYAVRWIVSMMGPGKSAFVRWNAVVL